MATSKVRCKLRELIRDDSIYPRGAVDPERVQLLSDALRSGAKFPPLHIDQRKRLLDGWHRRETYVLDLDLDTEIDCIQHQCRDDGEALKKSAELNAKHGLPLTKADRAMCLRKAARFGLGAAAMAAILGTSVAALKAMGEGRVAMAPASVATSPSRPGKPAENRSETTESPPLREVVLSPTVSHLSGTTLTADQATANTQLSGLPQIRLVNDVIRLLEADMIDRNNSVLMGRLTRLRELLQTFASSPMANEAVASLAPT